jgi:hypothetical protein
MAHADSPGGSGFYSPPSEQPSPPPSLDASKRDPYSAEVEHVSQMGFLNWMVTMQNKLGAMWAKKEEEERKAFKKEQDATFWERKQELHRSTAAEFGNSKLQVECMHQTNQERAAEYKEQLEEMKEIKARQQEEWAQFGYELTVSSRHMLTTRTQIASSHPRESGAPVVFGCSPTYPRGRLSPPRPSFFTDRPVLYPSYIATR